jgi:hypothetical protein
MSGMNPSPNSPILNYRGHRSAVPALSEAEWRWLGFRIFFRIALAGLFWLIAFHIGPNEILFGRLTAPSMPYFVPIIERECVPVVRAVKEYERDHGAMPVKLDDLVPRYLSKVPNPTGHYFASGSDASYLVNLTGENVEWNLTSVGETWEIYGWFATGVPPIRPVLISPPAVPTTTSK